MGLLGLLSHAKLQPERFGVRSVLTRRAADIRYSLGYAQYRDYVHPKVVFRKVVKTGIVIFMTL